MIRYKCTIAYDGTNFAGYQIQPDKRTVQLELEKVLRTMHKGKEVKVTASGRTDAGVHAKGQVIHFDSPLDLPAERWKKALGTMLPADIAIVDIEKANPEFHARFHTIRKEYRYIISLAETRDPFIRDYAYHYPYKLDLALMEKASTYLKGTHDFTSFCSAKTEVEDKVRTVESIDFLIEGKQMVIRFVGEGFLYNMVRIMVGTLLDIGIGKRNPEDIKEILAACDRTKAGRTAPGHGLYLWKVDYK